MSASPDELLVQRALERPASEREAFLERECAGDPALRQRIDALLATHAAGEGPDAFSGEERTTDISRLLEHALQSEARGTVIGSYRLLEKLGEGGFGTVWAAEQREPVKRRVALKIIKLGMDTQQVVARFEAERQALALMDHPNIARVLDAGATQLGRPYFVMELVKGVAITRYCEQAKLSTRDRLELYIKVCHAIQHAHQKGIIHRDIKPSNIMITLHDGIPVPKVIDFGIAKATQAELTEKTIYTQFGQFIGTPAYMSPEQAELSGLDIDTRSDIYSLGVLLYELLTGSTPFESEELLGSGLEGMRKIIREREPVRPSTRLRQTGDSTLAGGMRPVIDASSLASDLDWIVMRCLEKDRTRRYETANALAMDLTRHLRNEPVLARPPSAAYRLQKAWRRNRALYASGVVVAIALTVGFFGLSIGLYRAAMERTNALQSAQAAIGAAREAQEARALAEANAAALETSLYFNRVALAHHEHTSRPPNVRLAEEDLNVCPEHLRGWEWHHLKRRRFAEPLVLEDPGSAPARSVAFSADNRELAWGGGDGKIRIWLLEPRRSVETLAVHSAAVVSVTFSPTSSRWIASVGADAAMRLWDRQSASVARSWRAFAGLRDFGNAYCVAFSQDGLKLAAPDEAGEVRVRWVETGEDAAVLHGHGGGAQCVAFSQDGRWIATGTNRGAVLLWNADTGVAHGQASAQGPPLARVIFTRGTGKLMALYYDGSVKSWDPSTLEETASISMRTATGNTISLAMALHADGERLAVAGIAPLVSIALRATGMPVLMLREPTSACFSLQFSPDGNLLAAGTRAGKVYLWDGTPLAPADEPAEQTLHYAGSEVWTCAVAPDGAAIAAAGNSITLDGPRGDAPVMLWRGLDDPAPSRLPGFGIVVFSIAFHPRGQLLAFAGDGPVRPGLAAAKAWDLRGEREAFPIEAFAGEGRLFSLAFSHDGKWLVGGGIDRKIKSWDASTGRRGIVLGEHQGEIRALTCSADGKYLASAADESVKVWDAGDLSRPLPLVRSFSASNFAFKDSVAFDPTAARLAVIADSESVIIHDLVGEDRGVLLASTGHEPQTLAFGIDGRWVATGGKDCAVRIWDPRTGELRHTLKSHTDRVQQVRVARLGGRAYILSASLDGTVKLWSVAAIERQLGSP